jgi:hypothetical protein
MKLQVYDPSMCCSTGVCGPAVNPVLVRFAADLKWLREEGVEVERYNLSQQPAAFSTSRVVREELQKEGPGCLPLLLIDGRIAFHSAYPDRRHLAASLGIEAHARRL